MAPAGSRDPVALTANALVWPQRPMLGVHQMVDPSGNRQIKRPVDQLRPGLPPERRQISENVPYGVDWFVCATAGATGRADMPAATSTDPMANFDRVFIISPLVGWSPRLRGPGTWIFSDHGLQGFPRISRKVDGLFRAGAPQPDHGRPWVPRTTSGIGRSCRLGGRIRPRREQDRPESGQDRPESAIVPLEPPGHPGTGGVTAAPRAGYRSGLPGPRQPGIRASCHFDAKEGD